MFDLSNTIVTFENNYFSGATVRPYHFYYCTVNLVGNDYDAPQGNITSCTSYNGGWLSTTNDEVLTYYAGQADLNGAVYIQVVHGLYAQPNHFVVTMSCNDTDAGGFYCDADATYFTIHFGKAGYEHVYFACWVW
jgi:hypothetical protein